MPVVRRRALHANAVRRATAKVADRLDWSFATSSAGLAGNCEAPITRHLTGRNYADKAGEQDYRGLELLVRCRQCPNCRKARGSMWIARMLAEVAASQRTWLVTLTFRSSFWRKHGLPQIPVRSEGLKVRHYAVALKEAQLWLKRLREASPSSPVRFIASLEQHESGLPHIHMLVHEVSQVIPRAVRRRKWTAGFIHWSLVGHVPAIDVERGLAGAAARSCSYVAKYLVKQGGRVRASLRYGKAVYAPLGDRRLGSNVVSPAPAGKSPTPAPLGLSREGWVRGEGTGSIEAEGPLIDPKITPPWKDD